MKKLRLVFAVLVVASAVCAGAQTTAVTATVTDSDGTAWANGTFTALYAPVPGYGAAVLNAATGAYLTNPVSGTLNSSGVLSLTLVQTKYVYGPVLAAGNSPGVIFTVCPQIAGYACYSTPPLVISGTSQSVTAQINAAIKAPRVGGLLPLGQAYNDTEVAAVAGNQYTRLSDGAQRCYSSVWAACSTGGTITSVGAGLGLSGGGSSGAVTLSLITPSPVAGMITLTTATSDNAAITGVTTSSICVLSPTNSTATGATILPYISSVSANEVTISHAATVGDGATYNIVCAALTGP